MKTLTEGIRQRHMGATHQRLTEKWNRTGLLRGLQGYNRENMSVLLENQAAQLLRETNMLGDGSGSAGNIRGFQNVAFPIVRRVFGGLVANELVSIQPMSLPSGLLFYLDYTYGTSQGGQDVTGTANDSSLYTSGESIYNNPKGKGIQSGSLGTGGQYDLLGSGFSRVHDKRANFADTNDTAVPATGEMAFISTISSAGVCTYSTTPTGFTSTNVTGVAGMLVDFDQALIDNLASSGKSLHFALILASDLSSVDLTMLQDIAIVQNAAGLFTAAPSSLQGGTNVVSLRRHTKRVDISAGNVITVNPIGGTYILLPLIDAASKDFATVLADNDGAVSFVKASTLDIDTTDGSALTIPTFEHDGSPGSESPVIPEIDIKIESLAVTAVSRKLKAKWSPELAQDLNAYHSLDAEVELTQILSEQIALELDREVLNDLLTQANGANLYWSRSPGKFVNKLTGVEVARNTSLTPGPQFTGTVRDWYETLVETIIDAGNIIHRKTLRGSANFIVIGPDVATIFEASVMYKPTYAIDGQGQAGALSIGAEKIGSLSNRFTVYKDPYFPRNKILVGYKGGSYLETGYVYAPYVPLIVTPTIFAPEDFTPRKGVMTRYGKKMVRSDFYGTVTCLDMNII
jgi:hypothetical protein